MGLGLTIWSPLASGVLTGKYAGGIPPGSRLSKDSFKKRPDYNVFMKRVEQGEKLRPIAERMGCSMGQLALAWCMANPHVSTAITVATDVNQVDEQLGAVALVEKMTPQVMADIDAALGNDVVQKAKVVPKAGPAMRAQHLSAGARSKL